MLRFKFFLKKVINIAYVIAVESSGIGILLRLGALGKRRIAILTYHKVTDERAESYYCVSRPNFENQIKYLRDRFEFIDINNVIDYLQGRIELKRDSCCITFDDGYKDIYKHVFALVKEYRFPVAVGLVSDYIDKNREFSWDKKSHLKDKDILNWTQIEELSQWRLSFGSHSSTHANLALLNEEALRYEIKNSKYTIENILGKEVSFFIYPFGASASINQRVIDIVREAGYKIALTSIWGWIHKDSHPYMLRRINIDGSDTTLVFKAKLSGTFDLLEIFNSRPYEFMRGIIKMIFEIAEKS